MITRILLAAEQILASRAKRSCLNDHNDPSAPKALDTDSLDLTVLRGDVWEQEKNDCACKSAMIQGDVKKLFSIKSSRLTV